MPVVDPVAQAAYEAELAAYKVALKAYKLAKHGPVG
jgi:hypothetical protein